MKLVYNIVGKNWGLILFLICVVGFMIFMGNKVERENDYMNNVKYKEVK